MSTKYKNRRHFLINLQEEGKCQESRLRSQKDPLILFKGDQLERVQLRITKGRDYILTKHLGQVTSEGLRGMLKRHGFQEVEVSKPNRIRVFTFTNNEGELFTLNTDVDHFLRSDPINPNAIQNLSKKEGGAKTKTVAPKKIEGKNKPQSKTSKAKESSSSESSSESSSDSSDDDDDKKSESEGESDDSDCFEESKPSPHFTLSVTPPRTYIPVETNLIKRARPTVAAVVEEGSKALHNEELLEKTSEVVSSSEVTPSNDFERVFLLELRVKEASQRYDRVAAELEASKALVAKLTKQISKYKQVIEVCKATVSNLELQHQQQQQQQQY